MVALGLPTWYANRMLIVFELYEKTKTRRWLSHHDSKLNNGYQTIRQQNRACAVAKFKNYLLKN